LGLSPSTYFARKSRPKSARRLRDEQLMPLIEEVGSVDDLVIWTLERVASAVRDHVSRALVMWSWSCFRICPRC
ncbi:hypothetical protein, partial [Streptomyces sp. NRRL S-813]|uniref:hypothetical protein n=1 Tax=Streptomyces sp. NRRL S-813 TaxID=1463919 RepID=UPI001F15EBDE